jgi:hypothetical protein
MASLDPYTRCTLSVRGAPNGRVWRAIEMR